MIQHLACIMDGNRRWAKKKGWLPWHGHREGVQAAKRVMQFCLEKQISHLSLYTFSTENLKRSDIEKKFLFTTLVQEAHQELPLLKEKGIRVQFIGDRTLFPEAVIPMCNQVEQETAEGKNLTVHLLFFYGARQEIIGGVKKIISNIKNGLISEDDITSEYFSKQLWTSEIPEPDIIVRTGGMRRLSNFLLYQAAYSELFFLDCLWPDVQSEHLEQAVSFFNNSQRNFGV